MILRWGVGWGGWIDGVYVEVSNGTQSVVTGREEEGEVNHGKKKKKTEENFFPSGVATGTDHQLPNCLERK